jgi:RNA polymerase sigma-70 factor (ECF subfamily)
MSELAQALARSADEGALIARLRAGSEAAFDQLVEQYHATIYNVAFSMMSNSAVGMAGSAADAADITQEVFLKVFRGVQGFRGGSSLKTWLYRIAVREALNHRRWRWRHQREQTSLQDESGAIPLSARLAAHDASPFDETARHERQQLVRRALALVPPVFCSAVILRDLEGLSYEEVADILQVSPGTVKSRILRGRRALREILDPILHPTSSLPHRAHDENARSEITRTRGAAAPLAAAQAIGNGLRPASAEGGN